MRKTEIIESDKWNEIELANASDKLEEYDWKALEVPEVRKKDMSILAVMAGSASVGVFSWIALELVWITAFGKQVLVWLLSAYASVAGMLVLVFAQDWITSKKLGTNWWERYRYFKAKRRVNFRYFSLKTMKISCWSSVVVIFCSMLGLTWSPAVCFPVCATSGAFLIAVLEDVETIEARREIILSGRYPVLFKRKVPCPECGN
jgi:hypothetical protein